MDVRGVLIGYNKVHTACDEESQWIETKLSHCLVCQNYHTTEFELLLSKFDEFMRNYWENSK